MKHLYYCRHGQSELNLARIFAGRIDTPLTDRGRQQARLAGQSAKDLSIDLIVSSPLSRAYETAAIIAEQISYDLQNIVVDPLFVEQSYGSMQGQSWDTTEPPSNYTDMESDKDLYERAITGLVFLQARPESTILLVSHGDFGKALMRAIDPSDSASEPENAQIMRLL